MRIRLMERPDHDEWLRMRKALWPETSETTLEAELTDIMGDADNQAVFVAERPAVGAALEGAPAQLGGFVELSIHPHAIGCDSRNVGYLEGWYVDDDLRRTGIGRQLVAAGEAWARSKGCREIASDTLANNTTGLNAHLACGYIETERLVHFKKEL